MDKLSEGKPVPKTVFQNHHHFGGDLPDQHQSLLFWAKLILVNEPASPEALSKKFIEGEGLPVPIRVEVQEARKILQDG